MSPTGEETKSILPQIANQATPSGTLEIQDQQVAAGNSESSVELRDNAILAPLAESQVARASDDDGFASPPKKLLKHSGPEPPSSSASSTIEQKAK